MAEITINGVKYTNVPNKKAGTKFAASLTQSNIGASQAVQDYVNSSYFYPLVNAIDINWNGVEVDENSYINSTSDLITYIATKGSNVDLTSYATKNYVDQKIEDVVGGAPETLDTLKELADALANDATLAYVTEALDGKADKSSLDDYATVAYVTNELDKKADLNDIPSAPDLTPYVTYTQANSYYAGKNEIPDMTNYATVAYVTTELENKADVSDIPDMSSYVTLTYANSNYLKYTTGSTPYNDFKTIRDIIINGNICVIGHPNTGILIERGVFNGKNLRRIGPSSQYTQFGFFNNYVDSNNNVKKQTFIFPNGDITKNWNNDEYLYIPLVFTVNNSSYIKPNNGGIVDLSSIIPDMTNYATQSDVSSAFGSLQDIVEHDYATVRYVTTELENKADVSDIPDMTNYVDVTSYNALYAEVQHLAYLISYYHPSSPDPGPGQQFEGYWTLNGVRTDSITLNESDPAVTLSFVSNPTIASGIGTWAFYENDPKVIINTSTGEMTINPSLLGAGTVYTGAGYRYENGEYSTSFYITINVSSGKQMVSGHWLDSNLSAQYNKTVVAGDTTSYTFTFSGTPSDRWSFDYMGDEVSGLSIDTMTGTITIDMTNTTESTIRHMNVNANRPEDSTYYYGSAMFTVTVLPNGTNPGFYYDQSSVNISNTTGVMTPMLYDSISSRRGYVSSDTSIATVSNDGSINCVSDGTCTVTATAYDSSDNVLATAEITVYCNYDREWIDAHLYTSSNIETDSYGIVKGENSQTLTFTAQGGNSQEPVTGFTLSKTGDTYNAVSYTSTSNGMTITVDPTNVASINNWDNIEVTISRAQDSTYSEYNKTIILPVLPAGSDPLIWWMNKTFNVAENDVLSETPITGWLFNGYEDTTPIITFSANDIAHVDQDGILHGDSAGQVTMTATVTDGNSVTHTASATVEVSAASKGPAKGYFVDGNNNLINTPLVWSDEGGELDGMSATLVSEPASGWTGPVVSCTNNDLYSGSDYTISGNTITFGNIQSPPNVSTFTWSYAADSSYDNCSVELKVVGLQYGADTQFFPDCGNSTTIQIPAKSDVLYFNLINRTGIDHLQHPISVSSDNQNITVTSGPSNSFYITNTSTGTYQSANITATITDGNDTHTTSFNIDFSPSQPAQEYTDVSILYDVPNTQTTNLPQGTFDTNPFEVGSSAMGSNLTAHVEFSGPEYDMNNFNTDFVLTRDTSYAGNHTTVYMPQHPNSNIYNIYNNGINTITFQLSIYSWQGTNETNDGPGTNRDVLTFTHNGYNYLTDGIKTHAEVGAS